MFGTKVAKVAALQFVTVLLQAFGKLRLLGGIVIFGMEQQAAVQSFQLAFCVFFWIAAVEQPLSKSALHFPKFHLVPL